MQFVLGSRSPRRRELLEPVIGPGQLLIRPPTHSEEENFGGLHEPESIRQRLSRIVRAKMEDLVIQVRSEFAATADDRCLITADTVVVVEDPDKGPVVLGQPGPDRWQAEVRDWMLRLYSGATHEVWTGFQVVYGEQSRNQIVTTKVRMCELTPSLANRYIATEEPAGKAGGYAIQGAAAVFVEAIDGSLANVIGLPVMEVVRAMESMGIQLPDSESLVRGERTSEGVK